MKTTPQPSEISGSVISYPSSIVEKDQESLYETDCPKDRQRCKRTSSKHASKPAGRVVLSCHQKASIPAEIPTKTGAQSSPPPPQYQSTITLSLYIPNLTALRTIRIPQNTYRAPSPTNLRHCSAAAHECPPGLALTRFLQITTRTWPRAFSIYLQPTPHI